MSQPTALVMIRPTGVRLCTSHTGEHHLSGTVADVAFRGRGYEHAIDIPGHGRLTSVFSDIRSTRGEQVGLRLDPGGCHLVAAAAPGDEPASRDCPAPALASAAACARAGERTTPAARGVPATGLDDAGLARPGQALASDG